MSGLAGVPRGRTQQVFARFFLLSGLALLLACAVQARAAEAPPRWDQLTLQQQHILAPLRADWPEFDRDRKKKWLDIAARYPAMSPQQQQTLQRRMNEWAHLSPEKRRLARETFLSTGKAPLQSRREAWEAYKKLPEAERERLKEEARHPKPHPGQVGKYLEQKHAVKPAPAAPTKAASLPAAAATKPPATVTPAALPASAPLRAASAARR